MKRPGMRPTVRTFSDWLAWPARHALHSWLLWRWRRRPHRFECPEYGRTFADQTSCAGFSGHTPLNGTGMSRYYLAIPTVPIQREAA